jgi:tetratricopeptide (TPR) repeat protein
VGEFYYNPKDDALRVDVPVIKTNESVEWLTYTFTDQTDNSAVISLVWEKVKIPFKVSVDLKKDQIAEYRRAINAGEFHGYWQNMQRAANYCLVNNINLEEGLTWADRSINTFFGEPNFLTLSTYAGLLEKLGKKKDADSIMGVAIPKATAIQMSTYARNLLRQKRNQEAFDISKLNYDKNPENEYAVIGMVRAYYAMGNKTDALRFGEKAKNMFKDSNSKAFMDNMMADIKNGKDINK